MLAAVAHGQVGLEPQPAPPGIQKIVVHDQGGFWPTAMARHQDGSVTAFGNPWLGGAATPIVGLSGVADLARLDALTPGDTEAVAVVGTNGLSTVRWDATALGFVQTPFVDPALAGATMVRAAAFPPYHLISVVTAGGLSVRSYRGTGTHLSTITFATPVRGLELFRHGSGAARLLVRTDSGLACHALNGSLQWSLTGHAGVLIRWKQSPTVRTAWLHRPAPGANWQLTQLGDSGALSTASVAHAIAAGELLHAAFAADADSDGDCDLVVKTSVGVSVLAVPASGDFAQSVETTFEDLLPSAASVPDVVATHAGKRLRYVDEFGGSGVRWERVDIGSQSLVNGGDDISLEVYAPPIGAMVGGAVDRTITTHSHVDFQLRTTPEALVPFVAPGTLTRIQLVAWAQDDLSGRGKLDDVSESNLLLTLGNVPSAPSEDWLWPCYVDLEPICSDDGWQEARYYWLTIRLCNTLIGSDTPIAVSEPITLVTSLSEVEFYADWQYLTSWYFPLEHEFPLVLNEQQGTNGGGVVGVVERADLPPPPPPSGIPTPRANTAQGVITGQSGGA
jgi:hypothetical protein